jgi:hypothetical protein
MADTFQLAWLRCKVMSIITAKKEYRVLLAFYAIDVNMGFEYIERKKSLSYLC